MSDNETQEQAPFVSALGAGRDAFTSEIVSQAMACGERSSDDFIRRFPCAAIMTALANRAMERARIVSAATGMNERVALKMTPAASGEALQIALEEKVTTTAQIVELFRPDDRALYLEREALWGFLTEAKSWDVKRNAKGSEERYARAKDFVAYLVERGLANKLFSHDELLQGLTLAKLVADMPKESLGSVIAKALAEEGKFNAEHLFAAMPMALIVEKTALPYVWEKVGVPQIAEKHGYVKVPVKEPVAVAAAADEAKASSDAAAPASAPRVDASDDEEIDLESLPPTAGPPPDPKG